MCSNVKFLPFGNDNLTLRKHLVRFESSNRNPSKQAETLFLWRIYPFLTRGK